MNEKVNKDSTKRQHLNHTQGGSVSLTGDLTKHPSTDSGGLVDTLAGVIAETGAETGADTGANDENDEVFAIRQHLSHAPRTTTLPIVQDAHTQKKVSNCFYARLLNVDAGHSDAFCDNSILHPIKYLQTKTNFWTIVL